MKSIGERIKALRKNAHLTQQALGVIVDLHGSNISRVEQNMVVPTGDVIAKMSEYFHVSCDYILRGASADGTPQTDIALTDHVKLQITSAADAEEDNNVKILEEFCPLLVQLNENNQEELLEILKIKLKHQQNV
ncbi:helix-turn-helix domain-containing protein [[Clostridium] polysaccharolyticum]|jgi:transcriptional regulator with XRE-family HTH domain|uniref:Transcriptional regulator, contains XRE-family HTH domain n=1 Tax=[Clostridium] polysaccharolyticum TaxID=29364 RepID=A0A1I0D7K3_9FIRM|nr:helix-turn-helix transcriptional regulator [[Clostridium] polysaccharolyticum]SET28219.1 Transcriptional regulator, contains XRE-family HTH domain [[Clostridium] polysaccharolyticum]